MFYIKVMNKEYTDYSMFSTDRYHVARQYSGDCAPQKCESTIVLNDGKDGEIIPTAIVVTSTAYIMNDSGKTIDTVYTS